MRRFGVIGALLLAVCAGLPAHASIEEADRAFRDGDYPQSLHLYEAVLEDDPDNPAALFRSGLLLSWEDRLPEALERYDHLLRVAPGHREGRIERAKVLSWDGRLDEAVAALQRTLDDHPHDRQAELSLARCHAWNGDYAAARSVYGELLARDPADIEARVGAARAEAWSGRQRQARAGYRRALEDDPDNKDALVGLAYLDLWEGDAASAHRRAVDLSGRHPDDRDVRELHRATSKAVSIRVLANFDTVDDSDDNRIDTHDLSAGGWLGSRVRLGGGLAYYRMRDPSARATIESVYATLGLHPGRGQEIALRLAHERNEGGTFDESYLLGRAAYTWGLDRLWQVGLAASRNGFHYSPRLATSDITWDEGQLSIRGRVRQHWRLFVIGGAADFSDGNARANFLTGFTYRWPVEGLTLESGYTFRFLDYDRQLLNGYFDPSDFTSHVVHVRGNGSFGRAPWTYRFGAGAGLQSFERLGQRVSDDTVVTVDASLGRSLGGGFSLEIFGGFSNYAAQTAEGFESRQAGLRLRWQPGDRPPAAAEER